jgi:hypothetical protein
MDKVASRINILIHAAIQLRSDAKAEGETTKKKSQDQDTHGGAIHSEQIPSPGGISSIGYMGPD